MLGFRKKRCRGTQLSSMVWRWSTSVPTFPPVNPSCRCNMSRRELRLYRVVTPFSGKYVAPVRSVRSRASTLERSAAESWVPWMNRLYEVLREALQSIPKETMSGRYLKRAPFDRGIPFPPPSGRS